MFDPDAVAEWLYRHVRCSPDVPPGVGWLLELLVGRERVQFVECAQVFVRQDGSSFRVTIPRGLLPERRTIAIAIALAEVATRMTGWTGVTRENLLAAAAAIVMPRAALAILVERLGYDARELAVRFLVPEPLAEQRMRHAGWLENTGEFSERSWRDVI